MTAPESGAIDVLAAALAEARGNPRPFDQLDPPTQEAWTIQAEVVAGRMLEAERGPDTPPTPDTPAGHLQHAVQTVLDAAEALNVAAKDGTPATDWQNAVRLLSALRDTTDHIGVVVAGLTLHTYVTGEHGDQVIDGVGRVRIARGRDRTQWDARGAVFAYVDAKMIAAEGELPDPTDVADWVMEVLPATASTSCKVSGLKAVGLKPEAFCEDLPGKIGVTLPPR